jgi:hypothetical protein
MNTTEMERKCGELRIGSKKLAVCGDEQRRAWEFVLEMLDKHNADAVEDLPPDVLGEVQSRLRPLKTDDWMADESTRLDALEEELLGLALSVVPSLVPPGPVN